MLPRMCTVQVDCCYPAISLRGGAAKTRDVHGRFAGICLILCILSGCVRQDTAPQGDAGDVDKQAHQVAELDESEAASGVARELRELLEGPLRNRSDAYKSAVREVFLRQARFCGFTGSLDRVEVVAETTEGETVIEFKSAGRSGYGDKIGKAMTVRGDAVVGLAFGVASAIDSCPCISWYYPEWLDDRFMPVLVNIDTLESLDLHRSKVTDAGLSRVAEIPQLRSLDLHRTTVTSEGIRKLQMLSHLEWLRLSPRDRDTFYSPAMCKAVAGCRSLKHLDLVPTELNAEAIRVLGTLPQLEVLSLSGRFLGDSVDLSPFRGHRHLSRLATYIHGHTGRLTISEIANLKDMSIGTSSSQININALPNLESLSVGASKASADTPTPRTISVARLPLVMRLSLDLSSLSDEEAEQSDVLVSELPSLMRLNYAAHYGAFRVEGQLLGVREVTVNGHRRPVEVMPVLAAMPNVEELEFRSSTRYPVEAIEFARLHPLFNLKRLQSLRLGHVQGDFTFEPFRQLEALSSLSFESCEFGSPVSLSEHPSLTSVHLHSGAPREIVVRAMPKLERFGVVESAVFESATFIDTPSLRSLWFMATPELVMLDLADSGLDSVEQLDTSLGGKQRDEILRLPTSIDLGVSEGSSNTGSAER